MKAKAIKALSLCLLAVLIIGASLPTFAAAEKPELITGNGIIYLTVDKCPVVAANLPEDATSFKVKSNNKAVLKVGKQEGFGPYGWYMKPMKVGTATVTLYYKSKGKTRSVSGKFKVRNYPDPFEYIKINGKKISLKKNRSFYMDNGYTKDSITVTYKLKSNWKVTGLGGCRIKDDDWIDVEWKKNKALSLKGYDAADLLIELKNTKTGATCDYEIAVSRPAE